MWYCLSVYHTKLSRCFSNHLSINSQEFSILIYILIEKIMRYKELHIYTGINIGVAMRILVSRKPLRIYFPIIN